MTKPIRPDAELLLRRLAAIEQRLQALERMPSGRNSIGIGQLRPALKSGTPSDADYAVAPPTGSQVYDTSGTKKLWLRDAGTWRFVTFT